jgi:hypothetical protein
VILASVNTINVNGGSLKQGGLMAKAMINKLIINEAKNVIKYAKKDDDTVLTFKWLRKDVKQLISEVEATQWKSVKDDILVNDADELIIQTKRNNYYIGWWDGKYFINRTTENPIPAVWKYKLLQLPEEDR